MESGAGVDARVEVGPRAFGGRGRGLVAVGIAAAVGGVAAAVAAIGAKAAPELGGVILVLWIERKTLNETSFFLGLQTCFYNYLTRIIEIVFGERRREGGFLLLPVGVAVRVVPVLVGGGESRAGRPGSGGRCRGSSGRRRGRRAARRPGSGAGRRASSRLLLLWPVAAVPSAVSSTSVIGIVPVPAAAVVVPSVVASSSSSSAIGLITTSTAVVAVAVAASASATPSPSLQPLPPPLVVELLQLEQLLVLLPVVGVVVVPRLRLRALRGAVERAGVVRSVLRDLLLVVHVLALDRHGQRGRVGAALHVRKKNRMLLLTQPPESLYTRRNIVIF